LEYGGIMKKRKPSSLLRIIIHPYRQIMEAIVPWSDVETLFFCIWRTEKKKKLRIRIRTWVEEAGSRKDLIHEYRSL
jgi:hypothetical protein